MDSLLLKFRYLYIQVTPLYLDFLILSFDFFVFLSLQRMLGYSNFLTISLVLCLPVFANKIGILI